MKNWLICAVVVLLAIVIIQREQVKKANTEWENAMANVKAYSNELSQAEKKNTAYKITLDQMKYYKDSVLVELDNIRKQLKIKDKNLQSMTVINSTFTVRDTVILKDTIFKEPSFALDTIMGDEWYSMRLGLKYPSVIAAAPSFVSKKYVVVSSKRETVNPPKKFFLLRWFQKKHTVLNIDVVEKNPYVQNESSRYVEIIK